MIFYFHDKIKDTIITKPIRALTGSKTHGAVGYIEHNEAHVFEALGGRLGVHSVVMSLDPEQYHKGKHAANIELFEIDLPFETEAREFLKKQVGKRYDTKGFMSFGAVWMKQNPNAWYCSELQKRALEIGLGITLEHRISPTMMYNLVKCMSTYEQSKRVA